MNLSGLEMSLNETNFLQSSTSESSIVKALARQQENEQDRINQFACHLCTKNYSDRWALRNHIKVIHGPDKVQCPDCKKCFARKTNLREHQREVCNPTVEMSYRCPNCEDCFINAKRLRHHIKRGSCRELKLNQELNEERELSLFLAECSNIKKKEVHCFVEDCGQEVVLEEVEEEGQVYWAEVVQEKEFWGRAAGGLVVGMTEDEFA